MWVPAGTDCAEASIARVSRQSRDFTKFLSIALLNQEGRVVENNSMESVAGHGKAFVQLAVTLDGALSC
jgi:hypothetical protein